MTKRILIADDEPELLGLIKDRLESDGYQVEAVGNGKIVLDRIRQIRPDLIILDVMMPPPNGFQVCRKIKDDPALENLPVILLTAKTSESDRFWGLESGADAYVTKPYNPQELLTSVRDLLGRDEL